MKPTELLDKSELELDKLEAGLIQKMNERQVTFCRKLVIGGLPASEAYRQSGYSASENASTASAARLLTNASVKAYVAILQERGRRLAGIDVEYIIRRQLDLAEQAAKDGDRTNARMCLAEVAKLLNFYPEKTTNLNIKSEVTHDVTRISKTDWNVLREERRRREANRVH